MPRLQRSWLSKFSKIYQAYSVKEKLWTIFFVLLFLVSSFNVVFLSGGGEIVSVPVAKGIYTEGLVGSVNSLNPVFADLNEVERDVSRLVFSGLMKYDPVSGEFVDDLGTLDLSSDHLTYTFIVKGGVFWHDGQPFSVDDVYFTYHDVIQNDEFTNPILKANFQGIEIKQLDDVTIQFVLEKPNSFFATNLGIGILPKHVLGEIPVNQISTHSFNQNPIGTGPYMMSEPLKHLTDDRSEINLKIFSNYYDKIPSIANIRLFTFPNTIALINEKGALNGVAKISGEDADLFREDSRFELFQYTFPQYTAVFMNMDNDILKDEGVRLALAKAIPKEEILNVLSDIELVDTPLLQLSQNEWVYKYSVDEAQGALYEAGFKYPNGDQSAIRQRGGVEASTSDTQEATTDEADHSAETEEEHADHVDLPPLEELTADAEPIETLTLRLLVRDYTLPRQKQETEKLVSFLTGKWRAVGVDVQPEYAPFDTFLQRLQNRDYDLVLTGQSLGYNFDTYSFWHSTQANGNGLNLSNYQSFEVDALINDIRVEFDKAEEVRLLEQLATSIRDDVPALFLYRPVYYYASDGSVRGISLSNMAFTSDRFANVAGWKFVK